jgi:nitrate/nitrite transporter NarK
LGYTSAKAQLLTVPPYALATILTVIVAVISERVGKRAPFIISSSSLAIIGYILLLANPNPTKHPGISYAGTFLAAAGIYPAVGLSLAWPANNVSGQTKRATATAMQISIGNLGAVIGTQLYRPAWAPRYRVGHGVAMGYLVGNVVVVSIQWWLLERANREKERRAVDEINERELEGDEKVSWRFNA